MYIMTKHIFKFVNPISRTQHNPNSKELKEKLAKFLHQKNKKSITAIED